MLAQKRKDIELKQELAKLQWQLAKEEKRKEMALHDLDQAKKLLEHMKHITVEPGSSKGDVKECFAVVKNDDKIEQTGPEEEEKHVVWERQSRAPKEEPSITVEDSDLEILIQNLGEMKSELLATEKERDVALGHVENALDLIQQKTQKAEDLKKDVASINESLVSLKLSSIRANKEKVSLLEDKNIGMRTGAELELANEELRKAELEHKLAEAIKEMGEIQAEVASVKENEANAVASAKDAVRTLEDLTLELQSTKKSNESSSSSLFTLSNELEEVKVNLQKELNNITDLSAMKKSLLHDLETMKNELKSVKEREANATSAASILSRELSRIKSELPSAIEAEARANESIVGLSHAFEQVKAEAEEAKMEAESLLNEAIKANDEAEKAKSGRENAEILLKKALLECDVAMAAERDAIDKVKSLSMKTYASRASGVESGVGITISNDEYESLKRKVHEAEELANMRVAAAMAQVEAVRASEEEILHKLTMATEDMENIRNMIKEASRRLEMAEGAKSAVESELKRLREREQKWREKEIAIASQQQFYMRNGNEGRPSLSLSNTPPTSGPLGHLMSGELPMVRHDEHILRTEKKQPMLNSFGSYLSRRKSFSSSRSLKR